MLPSGKHTKNYGKSQFFNGYVCLPEGMTGKSTCFRNVSKSLDHGDHGSGLSELPSCMSAALLECGPSSGQRLFWKRWASQHLMVSHRFIDRSMARNGQFHAKFGSHFWRSTNPDVDTPQEKQPAGFPLLQSKAHLHHGDLKIFSPGFLDGF